MSVAASSAPHSDCMALLRDVLMPHQVQCIETVTYQVSEVWNPRLVEAREIQDSQAHWWEIWLPSEIQSADMG